MRRVSKNRKVASEAFREEFQVGYQIRRGFRCERWYRAQLGYDTNLLDFGQSFGRSLAHSHSFHYPRTRQCTAEGMLVRAKP